MTKQISFNYIKDQLGDYYGFNVFCDYRNKTIEALVGIQTDYETIEIKDDNEFKSSYGKWRYETEINDPDNKSFIIGMPQYEFIKDYKYAFCFVDKWATFFLKFLFILLILYLLFKYPNSLF